MIGTKKHITSSGIHILLLVSLLVNFGGCKEKDRGQDVEEPAPVEQTESIVSADQSELIDPNGRIKLRILCTTSPEEGRTDDFTGFLSKHFVKAAATDYKNFREELAKDFDVVIIDYGMRRLGTPVPKISRDYSRATVTIGVAGSMVCRRLNLKPGYL